ncbi:run domain Beclin-1-interacting and cysteine-rich domain-containing protein [Ostrinia furnacalis]|uniref:run domain Beclin-1-interacting and cysteine-rich domain-containing protein n=1 Tax=Ostrinia furnacalis TaxID=93504 RepID=UPI00103B2CF9|nr:run domain Beclin-1-interacting and cysteine-rich domain-containing protein [Ostrinia furnacalis]
MSFFKSVASGFNIRSRDTILKESLINNLSECVKDIQYTNQFEENFHSVLGSTDSTNTLCVALEAVFLHGLKDTLLRKAKNALSGDSDHRPQPNFWPLILVLSHRQNIDQISSLPQINTEIGQCRAWLRIALNECLLSSYMSTLLKNISAVKPFYNRTAFVCDAEILELAQKLIEGLESCVQFNLPINSSLLNQWPEQVLMLAGIWIPKIRVAPISTALDVASTITDEEVKPKLVSTPTHTSNITGLGRMLALNEDEALDFILSKDSKDLATNITEEAQEEDTANETNAETFGAEKPSSSQEEREVTSPTPSLDIDDFVASADVIVTGNSLSGKGWSNDPDNLNVSVHSNSSHGSSLIKTPELKSLSSLVDNSTNYGETQNYSNLHDIMKDIQKELKLTDDSDICEITVDSDTLEDPMLQGLDFEVVPNSMSGSFTVPELQKMIQQLGALSREQGLDHQNYQCMGCQDLLGSTISKAKVCAFTGEYYCSDCMDPNVFIIPARVIHNWDFKRYSVSKKSAMFLLEFQHHPWIDMKKLNPKIYCGVSDMAHLQDLRIQLNFLRAYIFTCREPVIEDLQKRVWPREYLYDHVHLYTISDLAQIPNGSLLLQLEKVVNFARTHVLDCWLCSQKGFICEVCRDPKILYPFETSTTYRCDECSSVFHSKCLNANIPCPKCKRKQNRTSDASLIDAVHAHFNK